MDNFPHYKKVREKKPCKNVKNRSLRHIPCLLRHAQCKSSVSSVCMVCDVIHQVSCQIAVRVKGLNGWLFKHSNFSNSFQRKNRTELNTMCYTL